MFWSWNSGKTARAPQPGDVLQADARGLPAWARTTGEILPFHGAPKTPGFPHYLDGLPMSVVSQLGYVDRGIRKRGIFSFVDDFLSSWGDVSGDFTGRWGPYRAHTAGAASEISVENYIAGALRLVADQTLEHDQAFLWQSVRPFNYVPGRRLWFSARPSLRDYGGLVFPTGSAAAVGLLQTANAETYLDQWPGDADHGVSGLYFLKKQGETDWSFYVSVSADTAGTAAFVQVAANVVTAALGTPPAAGQYVPLGFQIDPSGRLIVYVDGNAVGVLDATHAIWPTLTADGFGHDTLYGDFAVVAAVECGAALDGLTMNVDHVLAAEETQADAD